MDSLRESINEKNGHYPHVLVVEDELSVAKGLEMVLSEEGYGVDVAITGLDAINTFKGNGFALVVADLYLPDINGMDVIRQIKEERPDTKVVIITGYPSVSSVAEWAELGVSDYLRKPFTNDDFLSAVEKALK